MTLISLKNIKNGASYTPSQVSVKKLSAQCDEEPSRAGLVTEHLQEGVVVPRAQGGRLRALGVALSHPTDPHSDYGGYQS